MVARAHRCHLIERIIGEERIASQAELLRRLHEHGVVITQATLSRDLSAIGVVKGPRGYQLAEPAADEREGESEHLAAAVRSHLRWVTCAGQIVVLTTPSGHASLLAAEIDKARLPEKLGTIAGDDTIFVACRDQSAARQLCEQVRSLAGLEQVTPRSERRRPLEVRRA
ncbi:MAG: hypothetical protein KF724_07870 [Phycisphaeraceae bacterium]|nr:hypothetical protein [Phycisphaeraceae bacterium]